LRGTKDIALGQGLEKNEKKKSFAAMREGGRGRRVVFQRGKRRYRTAQIRTWGA